MYCGESIIGNEHDNNSDYETTDTCSIPYQWFIPFTEITKHKFYYKDIFEDEMTTFKKIWLFPIFSSSRYYY